jgi:hypothetical protein
VQAAQLRRGVDAELFRQDGPGPLVGQQRIGLSAGPVQGQQQLRPKPLPQRLLAHQPLQLGHQLPVAPQPQIGLNAILHGHQAQLAKPVSLGGAKVAVQELLEGLPPPQLQRLAQHRPGSLRRPVGQGAARRLGQLLKPRHVQGPERDPQQVARLAGHQHLTRGAPPTARLQRPPQAHHVRLQRLGRGRGWVLAPQAADERLHRHHPVGTRQEQGKQQAFLLPPTTTGPWSASTSSGPSTPNRMR